MMRAVPAPRSSVTRRTASGTRPACLHDSTAVSRSIFQTAVRARARTPATPLRPSFAKLPPSTTRGRRESRVPVAPAASRAKVIKHTSVVTTGSPVSPGLPCAMVLTAYFVLSPVTGLCCHRRLRNCFRQLDASVGASGPHDFAVRASAARLAPLPRPSHPAPNVRDDAYAPLVRTGWRGASHRSPVEEKRNISATGDWTAQIRLKRFNKLQFA
jgi:hypothetical protein